MRRFFRATDRATASRFTPLSLSPPPLSTSRESAFFSRYASPSYGREEWLSWARRMARFVSNPNNPFSLLLVLAFRSSQTKKKGGISRERQFAGKHGDKGGGKSAYISYLHLLWAFNYLADMRSKLATIVFLFLFLFGVGFRSVCGWRGSDKLEVMIRFGCRFHPLNQAPKGCAVTEFLSVGNAINTRLV